MSSTPKAARQPKGPYSAYWQQIFKGGLLTWLEFQELFGCQWDEVKEKLHQVFNCKSLAEVSPERFEAWIELSGLPAGMITKSRNAAIRAERLK
jgi:hypothetical protein